MAPRYGIADISTIIGEMNAENDRAAIVVGAATVDTMMQVYIEAILPPLPSGELERAFTEYGFLGTFSESV